MEQQDNQEKKLQSLSLETKLNSQSTNKKIKKNSYSNPTYKKKKKNSNSKPFNNTISL